MKTKYLSRAQAYAMCRDYQHLKASSLDASHKIDRVIVVPYSPILQWQFVKDLLQGKPADSAVNNPAERYEVIVLSKTEDTEQGFIGRDLRTYLNERSIPFQKSRYSCLRSNNIPVVTLKRILGELPKSTVNPL